MALAHAGLGWTIGTLAPGSGRQLRICCAAAALLPDVDALATLIAGSPPAAFVHNMFAGLLCIAAAALFLRDYPPRAWAVAVLLVGLSFGLHLVLDALLSGTELRLTWPLSARSGRFRPLLGAPLVTALGLVLAALPWALAFWKQVTPLEIVSERLDLLFLNLFRAKNRDCRVCGKGCNNRCSACRKPVCFRHARLGRGFRLTCEPCRSGPAPKTATAVTGGVEDYLARHLSWLRGKEAVRLDADFASFLHRKLTEGLRRLDDLPRTHAVWQGSDQKPTLQKLIDLSRTLLRETPDDDASRWVLFADRILTNSPDAEFSLIEPAILRDFGELRWMVSAARWRYVFSGINPVRELRAPLESLGKTVGPIEPFLETLKGDPNPATKGAAEKCLELLRGNNPFKVGESRQELSPTAPPPQGGQEEKPDWP